MPPELRHLQAFLAVADQKLAALDPRPHVICRRRINCGPSSADLG